jgi:WhiB family transcriptional regulator, redox-sensing transcriptional regulator
VEAKSKEAKKICLQCPVIEQCRERALDHRESYGVWGGLSEGERDKILSGRARKRRDHQKIAAFYATGA